MNATAHLFDAPAAKRTPKPPTRLLQINVPPLTCLRDVSSLVRCHLPSEGKVIDIVLAQPPRAKGPLPTNALIFAEGDDVRDALLNGLANALLYHHRCNPEEIPINATERFKLIDPTCEAWGRVEALSTDGAIIYAKEHCSMRDQIQLGNMIFNHTGPAVGLLGRFMAMANNGTASV